MKTLPSVADERTSLLCFIVACLDTNAIAFTDDINKEATTAIAKKKDAERHILCRGMVNVVNVDLYAL